MSRTSGLSLEAVRKSYGAVQVLHGVDLEVDDGDFTVFVGPSGCGKSTLLRMIAGLEEVTDGEIRIKGRDVTDLDPSQRGISMVFQSYALYPHMDVRNNLGFGLKMAGIEKGKIAERVARAADILKIEHLLDRRPGQLSGGQRQRVAIGRAIVREPDVFLFDEPLSNLDAELRVTMRVEIARLHKALGNTMVYVTHDQTEAMTLADRIVILRDGRIEQVGSPREVYQDPANSFVAGFIGSPRMNFLMADRRGAGGLWVGDRELAEVPAAIVNAQDASLQLGVRPEHIEICDATGGDLQALVDFTEYLGTTRYVYCRLPDGQSLVVEQRSGPELCEGDLVGIRTPLDLRLYFGKDGRRLRATP